MILPGAPAIDVTRLIDAYFADRPDPGVAAQRVAFGTSGHRGSAFDRSFNEWHVLAIAQAVCDQRRVRGITGPLFLGIDTHALSGPAGDTVTQVLAANGVALRLSAGDAWTPTPAISHAILAHNRGRDLAHGSGLADGIVLTPSHNPPRDGGFKYNPPHGGPAGTEVTAAIEAAANHHLETALAGVKRCTSAVALQADTTLRHDFRAAYVADLGEVVDFESIRRAGLRLGVDPLGGAGVHYWAAIADRHRIALDIVSEAVDPTFAFMPPDADGLIRMDPSSPHAMRRLIDRRERYDVAFACDTDHDRHGIVTAAGLMPANHYLCAAIEHLFRHRPRWRAAVAIGKTMVSTQLIDRLAAGLGRRLFETPVGFKWFAPGLHAGRLGFAGEESAGASFLRRDGQVWTTDKDGIAAALLAAEITAVRGQDPARCYAALAGPFGDPVGCRLDTPASAAQRRRLAALTPGQVTALELAGERITSVRSSAPGNGAALGGIRVATASGWFAARPSGTEDLCKLYVESFRGEEHLQALRGQAQAILAAAIGPS